jgi:biotin-dependent carboxylase-like uncharacterized protein
MSGWISVLRTSSPILVQDLGRPGLRSVGVPGSGAFDRGAAALAQRLVGNDEREAGLELLLADALLRTDTTVSAVLTGAPARARVGTRVYATNEVFPWQAGADLLLTPPTTGLRTYLAVRGGFDVAPVLGSCATDVLSGLGPAPLHPGDDLPLAHRPAGDVVIGWAPPRGRARYLRVVPGPREEWFAADAFGQLTGAVWTVGPNSNRVGLRLSGPLLQRRPGAGELPSEPLQRGAVQVPPAGQPIVLGPDHPTTGGYPVLGCVVAADWDWCAQLRPGDEVRFVRG